MLKLFHKLLQGDRVKEEPQTPLYTKQTEAHNQHRENRAHPRHETLAVENFAQLELAEGCSLPLLDISYGGCRAQCQDKKLFQMLTDAGQANLNILGLRHFLNYRIAHANEATYTVGLRFCHQGPEGLVFLRDFLEPMRLGSTLVPLQPDVVKEKYRAPGWTCYRGDGPIDLITEESEGSMSQLILTFPEGEGYCECIVQNGKVFTGKTIDTQGIAAARVTRTNSIDPKSLRVALCILLGSSLPCRELIAQQLYAWLPKPTPFSAVTNQVG